MQSEPSNQNAFNHKTVDNAPILPLHFTKPTIALSINASDFELSSKWAVANGFAIEYTPDPLNPGLIARHVSSLGGAVPLRYHCRFSDFELGNTDSGLAAEAMRVHLRVLRAVGAVDGSVVTVHLNLNQHVPFDAGTGLQNLTRLVEYASNQGLTVCLENLKRGQSSNPENILNWAKASGAMITLDIGHAVSCELVKSGALRVEDFADIFGDRLHEAHVYGREDDRHYPIEEIAPLEPVLGRLLTTGCDWWTVELQDTNEAWITRERLNNYLSRVTR